jgi:intracellular sulfur oxidation DsrE/DsrF family protein
MNPHSHNSSSIQSSTVTIPFEGSEATAISIPQRLLTRLEEFRHRKEQEAVDAPVDQLAADASTCIEAQISELLNPGQNSETESSGRIEVEDADKPIVAVTPEGTSAERPTKADLSCTAPQNIPTLGFDALISQIKMAAATIASLVKENEMIRVRAGTAISFLRADVNTERGRADQLQNAVADLQARHMRALDVCERSVRDIEAERQYLACKVQQAEVQLEETMRRLDAINHEVLNHLKSSMAQLSEGYPTRKSVA